MTSKKSGDALFYNLNQYCIESLNKKHKDFIEGIEDFDEKRLQMRFE